MLEQGVPAGRWICSVPDPAETRWGGAAARRSYFAEEPVPDAAPAVGAAEEPDEDWAGEAAAPEELSDLAGAAGTLFLASRESVR